MRMESNDMDWIGAVATTHYATCEQIFQHSDGFLPFRLCTVFSSPATVLELLKARQSEIEREFERLKGKAEFGLKVWGRNEWLTKVALTQDPKLREMQAQIEQGSGKAFFAQKKFEGELADRKKRVIPQLGRRLAATVSAALGLAPDQIKSLSLPPHNNGQVAVVNLTLLLEQGRATDLQTLAERIDREILEGGLIEMPGPLPPYSFISLGRDEENETGTDTENTGA